MEKFNRFLDDHIWIVFVLVLLIFVVPFFRGLREDKEQYLPLEEKEKEEIVLEGITATVYNAVPEQCDSDPLITADGSVIDTVLLREGKLKWIAISRDLLEVLNFGDKVWIDYLQEEYEVHDLMGKRFTNSIDILVPNNQKEGKFKTTIRKEKED